jgi:hypothetical protein
MFYFNDEEITTSELLDKLGAKEIKEELAKYEKLAEENKPAIAVFRLKKVRIDPSGTYLFSPQVLSNEIFITLKGIGRGKLVVSDNPPYNQKGTLRYEGANYMITEPIEIIDVTKDVQKFIFFMLYPSCQQSPFKKDVTFFLEDREKESKQEVEKFLLKDKAYEYVKSLPIENKKVLLAGLGVIGSSKMNENEVLLRLYQQIETDAKKFFEVKDSSTTVYYGNIQLAIESRTLYQETKNNVTRWFMEGINEPLCVVANGSDPVSYIKSWFLNNSENYRFLVDKVSGNTEADKIAKVVDEVKESPLQKKINELIEAGIIYLDTPQKQIKFVEGEAVHIVETLETLKGWKTKAYEKIKAEKDFQKLVKKQYDELVATE